MWRYLKSAFFVRVPTPGLGHVPVNALVAAGFAILGFAQPAFWLVGLALEATIVPGLAFNPRFQKYLQAQQLQLAEDDDEAKRLALVQLLDKHAQRRLDSLAARSSHVLDIYRSQQADEYIIDSNRRALNNLMWVYLKLLVARHNLTSQTGEDTESDLQGEIAVLDRQLEHSEGPDSLRESRLATQAILKKRLANVRRRSQTVAEIDSDLTRIEAQVDLVSDNATMQTKPQTISTDIELASDLVGAGAFGDHESEVCELDRKYFPESPHPQPPQRERETAG